MSKWEIRNADEQTRRIVKVFAAKNGLTVAEALAALVKAGSKVLK